MASGVKVNDEVKLLLDDMKVNRNKDDANKRIRIAILQIDKDMKEIEVGQTYTEEFLRDKGNVYEFLQNLMSDGDCKYIVYDCHYRTADTEKEDLVFIMWSSDNAKMKMKMPYASSKVYLKKLIDVKHEFEFHGMEEITPQCFVECITRLAKSNVVSLEGKDMCGH